MGQDAMEPDAAEPDAMWPALERFFSVELQSRREVQEAERGLRRQTGAMRADGLDSMLRRMWSVLFERESRARQAVTGAEERSAAAVHHRANELRMQWHQHKLRPADVMGDLRAACRALKKRLSELTVLAAEAVRTPESPEEMLMVWSPKKALESIAKLEVTLEEKRSSVAQLRQIAASAGLELPKTRREQEEEAERLRRRRSTAESEDLACAAEVQPSPRGVPRLSVALTAASLGQKDGVQQEQVRQEMSLRINKKLAQAMSHNDVDALRALQAAEEGCSPSQSLPVRRQDTCDSQDLASPVVPAPSPRGLPPLQLRESAADSKDKDAVHQEQLRQERAGRHSSKFARAASYQNVDLFAKGNRSSRSSSSISSSSTWRNPDTPGSCESQDLAEPEPAPESPRGVPGLRMSPRVPKDPPAAADAAAAPTSTPDPPGPTPEDLQKMRDDDALYQEILRQERAARRQPWMTRAASYDDVGRLADLLPKVDLTALKKLVEDGTISTQVDMESRGRWHKHLAKSESMMAVPAMPAAMPKLETMPAGYDPRTPTRGNDAEWQEQIEQEAAERRRRSGRLADGATTAATAPILSRPDPGDTVTSFQNAALNMSRGSP